MPFDRDRLDTLLLGLLGSKELVQKWWTSPNKAFKDVSPEELFNEAPNVVINYILNQFKH